MRDLRAVAGAALDDAGEVAETHLLHGDEIVVTALDERGDVVLSLLLRFDDVALAGLDGDDAVVLAVLGESRLVLAADRANGQNGQRLPFGEGQEFGVRREVGTEILGEGVSRGAQREEVEHAGQQGLRAPGRALVHELSPVSFSVT